MTDYNEVPLIFTGDWIDAAWVNQYIGDNLRAFKQGFVNAGDIAYAVDGNTIGALAKPTGVGILQNSPTGMPSYLTGGNALDVLRKNATNNGVEFASVGIKYAVAGRSADFSHTSGVISWNTDILDPFNWHSTSSNTSRITVTETGVYICGGMLRHFEGGGGSPTNNTVRFYLNGSAINNTELVLHAYMDNVSKGFNPVSRPIAANAGQYFEMGATLAGGRTVIADYSCFWAIKIA